MRFGKKTMFFFLNGSIAIGFLIYFLPWIFSGTVDGEIVSPYTPSKLQVTYTVDNKVYRGTYMRNGVSFRNQTVNIRYLRFHPSTSCVNSFMGMWAEPLAWWGVFLFASGALLFTNNGVFSKGTVFQLQKKYPWLSMEEYFQVQNTWFWQTSAAGKKQNQNEKRQLPGKNLVR